MATVNSRDAGIPLYTQVAETLRRRIHVCDYPEGSQLPNSEELEKEFGVSEITIRKALAVLAEEGLLERKRGRGTFVSHSLRDLVAIELSGSTEHLVRMLDTMPTELSVLGAGVVTCPNGVATALGLEAGAPVWRLEKLRSHRGSPFCHYHHYCRPELGRLVSPELAANERFPELFTGATGVRLASIQQRLEAVSADGHLAHLLRVNFGAPLLHLENLYVTDAGASILLSQLHYRADRVTVRSTVELPANSGASRSKAPRSRNTQ